MKLKKVMTSMIACAAATVMAITPVMAATDETAKAGYDKAVVDTSLPGSITIHKIIENNGVTNEADGQLNPNENRVGIPNVLFEGVKIGNLVNIGGTLEDGTTTAVGFYYDLTPEFKAEANILLGKLNPVKTVDDYDTVISTAGAAGVSYFSAEQVENILEAMKTCIVNADGVDVAQTWNDSSASAATGEVAINAWVHANAGRKQFPTTNLEGVTSLAIPNTDQGLYLIAETGYVDKVDEAGTQAKAVYRSVVYDANGVMSEVEGNYYTQPQGNAQGYATHPEGQVNPTIGQEENAISAAPNVNGIISYYDRNYNDDRTADDTSDAAEKGTENPVVLENPCSPFLVSVPMTNVSAYNGEVEGTVWQYDVHVYPKNSMTTIYKRVIADDGDTLDQEQDYDIGQNIPQVIYADAPATMFNHRYQQFEITDTMSKGLTFQGIVRVAYGPKVAAGTTEFRVPSATKLSDFNSFTDMVAGTDYNIFWNDDTTATNTTVPVGKADVQKFTIKLTSTGLDKISDVDGNGTTRGDQQVIVVFDTVLNKDAIIGAQDGKTFNVNAPTLTWRHDNTATRKIEGNEVKIYTYELDLTKVGKDVAAINDNTGDNNGEGSEIRQAHNFDASEAAFTIMQNRLINATVAADGTRAAGAVTTLTYPTNKADLFLKFVKESDGVYHVYTPTDGQIKSIVKHDTKAKTVDGKVTYEATPVNADGVEVYEIVRPAASNVTNGTADESGKLVIKGLDSETYTFTEVSTSKQFNLLKSTFDVTLKAVEPKDGNLVTNDDATKTYGASLKTDGVETGLAHDKGIVTMTVNNYKTITLHTGGTGMVAIYTAAVLALLAAAGTAMYIKRRRVA